MLDDDHSMLKLPKMFAGISNDSLDYVSKIESLLLSMGLHEYLLSKTVQNTENFLLNSNQFYLSIPSAWICSDFGKNSGFEMILIDDFSLSLSCFQSPKKLILLVEPGPEIRLVLDHFQLLQFLQLQQKLVELIDQIDTDRDFFTKSLTNPAEPVSIGLFCLAENVRK